MRTTILIFTLLFFLNGCGSDPSRPYTEPSIPVQVGIIQPDLSGFLSRPRDIEVAPEILSGGWAARRAELDMEVLGIAWSPSGQLFVVDRKNFRVVILDRVMNYRGEFSLTGFTDPDSNIFPPTDYFGRSFSFARDGSFLISTTQISAAIFR